MKNTIFSNRGETNTVIGDFFTFYSAVRNGKRYEMAHLSPGNTKTPLTADALDAIYEAKGRRCPFNGDSDFTIIKLQQRFF